MSNASIHEHDVTTTFADLMFLLLLTILAIFATELGSTEADDPGNVNPVRTIIVEADSGVSCSVTWNGDQIDLPEPVGHVQAGSHPVYPPESPEEPAIMWAQEEDPFTGAVTLRLFISTRYTGRGDVAIVAADGATVSVQWSPPAGSVVGSEVELRVTDGEIWPF